MKTYLSIACAVFALSGLHSFADQPNTPPPAQNCDSQNHHWDHKGPDGDHGPQHHEGPGFEQDKGEPWHHMEDLLKLTDAQKKNLADARAKAEPEHKALHEKMKAAHDALRNAGESQADDATLKKLANDLASVIVQQELSRIQEHRAFIAQLTPEQKQTLEQWKKDHPRSEHFDHPHP